MTTGCVLFTGHIMKNGYGQKQSMGRVTTAHRAVMEAILGHSIPYGLEVRHTCDVRACVNPEHLIVGTRRENFDDMVAKGRHNFRNRAKLTDAQVKEIRATPKIRGSGIKLAKKFGVSASAIGHVRSGLYYSCVPK